MNGPFYRADPRPEDWHDPEPRPEDWHDPEPRPEDWHDPEPRPEDWHDPEPRPEDWHDPEPRPEDWHDPEPRPEDWHDPEPRPEDWHDPEPRPEDWHDPEPRPEDWHDPDPAVRGALDLLRRRRWRCRPRRRGRRCGPDCCKPCCCRRPRRRFPMAYSGRIVVRLSPALDLSLVDELDNLREAAGRLRLTGLRRVLRQYGVPASRTGRLVDVVDRGRDCAPDDDEQSDGYRGKRRGGRRARSRPTTYQLEQRAARSVLPPLHPLSSYWRIDARRLRVPTEAAPGEWRLNGWEPSHVQMTRRFVRQLNELPEVDLAYRELAVSDPSPDDTYLRVQEYMDRAPAGIGVRWVWRHTPAGEANVGFMDLEQGWLAYDDGRGQMAHEDLDLDLETALVFGDNLHGFGDYRGHHGTAVLGEVLATQGNEKGVFGISKGVRAVQLVSHWDASQEAWGNVANAIRHAIDRLDAGDVLLLEVQRSYLPTEVDPADRDAIRLAVAHGIIVIEAAGNGNTNLDRYVDELGQRVLARRHPQFRESGALMVAAARSAWPHNRLSGRMGVGSNHGSRIDCFAHGDRVVTAGYGDVSGYLEPPGVGEQEAAERSYTNFGGTSSAAPIVAGAALLVQGVRVRLAGTRLSPWEMRRLLSDPRIGTRQGRGVRGRIGVMPDLRRILRERLGLVSDLYLRDALEDDGAVPVARRTGCSPDIVLLPEGDALADPLEEGAAGLMPMAPGDGYSVFVRLRNRGLQPAEQADVRVYRGPVATLVTPDLWHEVEAAPGGGALAVADAPVWSGAFPLEPPDGGHCCLIATVQDRRDEDGTPPGLAVPPSRWPYFDWRRYLSFLRWHANIAFCNVHRVAADREVTLPFLVTGTPDRARTFELEIVRDLAPPVTLALDAQAALASQIGRSRLWQTPVNPGRPQQVRLVPPRQPRVRIGGLRLVAGARFPCAFLVAPGARAGDRLAVRQLYRGREVGRITWRFEAPGAG